jgi:hypothetical protein
MISVGMMTDALQSVDQLMRWGTAEPKKSDMVTEAIGRTKFDRFDE